MSSRERVIPDACELIKFNNVIEKSFLSLSLVCEKKSWLMLMLVSSLVLARICLLDYHTHHRQASGSDEKRTTFDFRIFCEYK